MVGREITASQNTASYSLRALAQRRLGAAIVTLLLTAMAGFVVARTMPHGPATAGESLAVMFTGLITGVCTGVLLDSRWAVPMVILVTIASVELGRLEAVGPTVDALRLNNVFGILAFVLGRGFHGQEDLTRDFVLVAWDQRGAGKSYAALDPTSTLTLQQAIADTIELTNYLRERFDEEKIYLLGESWGTTLAVLAAQQRPVFWIRLLSCTRSYRRSTFGETCRDWRRRCM